jgi:glutamate-1-semialdehyde 2,1-aminomutase
MTHFVTKGITKINNSSDAARCDTRLLQKFHFDMIAQDGIFFLPGKLGAFSDAHSDADVKSLIDSAEKFAQTL